MKVPSDPFTLFQEWMKEAEEKEINDPGAMCLATVSADGQPSARMVLLKGVDERGFKFHTNAESRKGQDILQNNRAGLCFFWKSTQKQVRVEGKIIEASSDEADAYFHSRPRARQIGAWASQQSRPHKDRKDLEDAVAKYEQQFAGQNVPRPPYWKGFILQPSAIEFWQNDPNRLHDRMLYTISADGVWDITRLYP